MRRFIFIPLLLFSLIASATDYYVKTGGDDSAAGTADGTAWAHCPGFTGWTGSVTLVPGDNVYFKKGDTFTGTLTPNASGTVDNFITFGAYGAGTNPIITPNTTFGGSWTVHSGNIWKTTLGYNPGNMMMSDTIRIQRIHDDNFVSCPPTAAGYYSGMESLQLMALATDYTFSINSQNVEFWDGIEALYCYNSGTTYFRFREGEDPNDSTFTIAATGSNAIYINARRYITIQNITILGGEVGVNINNVNYTGNNNIIIENCVIKNSDKKVYIHNRSHGIIIRDNVIRNHYLSDYKPGAWGAGTTYDCGVKRHYYEFGKYRTSTSSTDLIDCAVYTYTYENNRNTISGNTIDECLTGIVVYGTSAYIYDNEITGTSSYAILFYQYADACYVHHNYIEDCDKAFRFQWVDNTIYPGRTNYVYRNRIYSPDAGETMYIHYGSTGPSQTIVWFYHNSIMCKQGISCSYLAYLYPGYGSGFRLVNNIISCSGYAFYSSGWSGMDNFVGLFDVYYNWISGTYYGASGGAIAVWANDVSNLNHTSGPTFWDNDDPDDFDVIEGTAVVDAGIDLSAPFTLDEEYPTLPGAYPDDYTDDPDMGYFEFGAPPPPIGAPTVTTQITSYNVNSAIAGGVVTDDGGASVTARGVCWSTSEDPDLGDDFTSDGTGIGPFTSNITGLSGGITYYVRAYATNSEGTKYGTQYSFTTPTGSKGTIGGIRFTIGGSFVEF